MSEVVEEWVKARSFDGSEIDIYSVRPSVGGPFPAVIIVHEIWGVEANIMSITRRVAREGYAAFAPHLYSRPGQREYLTPRNLEAVLYSIWSLPPERRSDPKAIEEAIAKAPDPQAARRVYELLVAGRAAMEEQMVKDLVAVYNFIKGLPYVRGDKIGGMGFCMGGGLVFQLATQVPLAATVVFYGANPRPIEAVANIKGPVLGIYAGEDPGINAGLPQLVEAMVKYGKDFEMKIYPGTRHAFFNDLRPSYNPEAARDAWLRTINFLARNLK